MGSSSVARILSFVVAVVFVMAALSGATSAVPDTSSGFLIRPTSRVSASMFGAVEVGAGWWWSPSLVVPHVAREPVVMFASQSEPYEDSQWHLDAVGVSGSGSLVSSGVVVAVLDTPINISHPDVAPVVWTNAADSCGDGVDNDKNGYVDDCHGFNMVLDEPTRSRGMFEDMHGTHVASTVASPLNGVGVRGVAPGVTIMPVPVLSSGVGSSVDAVEGVMYAVLNGADVLNMSWGSYEPSQALRDALVFAASRGVVMVAAAGNDSSTEPMFPAAYEIDAIVSVGASDRSGSVASFSNRGATVDVFAPGVGIVAADGVGYRAMSGTSMAAPQVAGLVAWLKHDGLAAPSGIVDAIVKAADPTARRVLVGSEQLSVNVSRSSVVVGETVTFETSDGESAVWMTPLGRVSGVSVVQVPALRSGPLVVSASRGDSAQVSVTVEVVQVPGDAKSDPLIVSSSRATLRFDVATVTASDSTVCGTVAGSLFVSPVADVTMWLPDGVAGVVDGTCVKSGSVALAADDVVMLVSDVRSIMQMRVSSAETGSDADVSSVVMDEGSSKTFGVSGERVVVPKLGVDSLGPVSVGFPDNGIFVVLVAEREVHVQVNNVAPAAIVSSPETGVVDVEVFDPGKDVVQVVVSYPSGVSVSATVIGGAESQTVSFTDVPSGYGSVVISDDDGGVTLASTSSSGATLVSFTPSRKWSGDFNGQTSTVEVVPYSPTRSVVTLDAVPLVTVPISGLLVRHVGVVGDTLFTASMSDSVKATLVSSFSLTTGNMLSETVVNIPLFSVSGFDASGNLLASP